MSITTANESSSENKQLVHAIAEIRRAQARLFFTLESLSCLNTACQKILLVSTWMKMTQCKSFQNSCTRQAEIRLILLALFWSNLRRRCLILKRSSSFLNGSGQKLPNIQNSPVMKSTPYLYVSY